MRLKKETLRVCRSYKRLIKDKGKDCFALLKDELTRTEAGRQRLYGSSEELVQHYSKQSSELAIRRKLVEKHLNRNLNRYLLESHVEGFKINRGYPIPQEWQKVIKSRGFRVSSIACTIRYIVFIFLCVAEGFQRAGLISVCLLLAMMKGGRSEKEYYCIGLSSKNLSLKGTRGRSYTFYNWLITAKRLSPNQVCIERNKSNRGLNSQQSYLRFSQTPFVFDNDKVSLCMYFWRIGLLSYDTLVSLIMRRPELAILFKEIVEMIAAECAGEKGLPKAVLIPNQRIWNRPLWTYVAEARGSKVILWFYSVNNTEPEAAREKRLGTDSIYSLLDWPIYWAWNRVQQRVLENIVHKKSLIEIVGYVDFEDDPNIDTVLPSKKFIALFDIPMRSSPYYEELGLRNDLYRADIIGQFIIDVCEVANSYGYAVAWKTKRITKTCGNSYKRVRHMLQPFEVIEVSSSVAPRWLIERSAGCVSLPYTSTGAIAQMIGVPSVFYDCTNSMKVCLLSSNGVKTVQGKDMLIQWVKSINDLR